MVRLLSYVSSAASYPAGARLGLDRRRARQGALALAAARAALGVTALVAPSLPASPWVGREDARQPAVRLFARTLGGRDLALGLGALMASTTGERLRGWIEAGALADTGDTVATLVAFKRLPRITRWGILASTLGATAVALLVAPLVDD